MFKRTADFWRENGPILRRIRFEATVPAICGILWGLLAHFHQNKPIFDSISIGFTAFFFIFFLQGQVLRVAKNVRDEDNANEFRNRFDTIQEGLDEIRKQRQEEPGAEAPPEEIAPVPAQQSFIDQARASIEKQLYYPAVLVASVGFEYAARAIAERWKIESRRSLGYIIRSFSSRLQDDGVRERLETLVQMRNRLVHPNPDSTHIGPEEATQLVDAFEEGIHWLQYLGVSEMSTSPSYRFYK